MRDGPSESADRSRFQTTPGGCGQKPWSCAQTEKAWEEPGQVTGKKRTAMKPLITCRKRRDDVKTAGSRYRGISLGDDLFTDRDGIRHGGGLSLPEAIERNVGTWDSEANGEATSGRTTRARVRKRSPGAEQPVVATKSRKRDGAKGLRHGAKFKRQPAMGGTDE